MNRILTILFLYLPAAAFSQALTGINFFDWYNPASEVKVAFQEVRGLGGIQVFYELSSNTDPNQTYSITWEKRDSYTQREGPLLVNPDSINSNNKSGLWRFDIPIKPWLLVMNVVRNDNKKRWVFFKRIEANFPVTGWIEENTKRVTTKYIPAGNTYTVNHLDPATTFVSLYKEVQQAPLPPFSESIAKSDRFIFHDSTFSLQPGEPFIPTRYGLYLFQKDTNAAEGFAVRVTDSVYPKFSSIDDLRGPLIFICTQDEYRNLIDAQNDKAKFDKVILDITRDAERAKNFMRSYFRRVQLSNEYFSSYKEGWKTDRGMIFLIFGTPDEVNVNDGSETWFYRNTRSRFTFVKSGSVYDPENFVLLRNKRFTEAWFSTIDLWRKSRF